MGRLERACESREDTTYLMFSIEKELFESSDPDASSMLAGGRCPKQTREWLSRGIFQETPQPAPRPCWTSSSRPRLLMRAIRMNGREEAGEEVRQVV
jgi:hypothetical protein